MQEGQPSSNLFYLLQEGAIEDVTHSRDLHSGDYFGEVGLPDCTLDSGTRHVLLRACCAGGEAAQR